MKKLLSIALIGLSTLHSAAAIADPNSCTDGTCVPKKDLDEFVALAKEQQCRNATPPKFTLDPVTIVVDKDGRVYGSGEAPSPYHVHVSWCNYEVDGAGDVKLQAAVHVDPDYGFRLRPKISPGILPFEIGRHDSWTQAVEVSLLMDVFYYKWLNLSFHAGFRSFGAGVSGDLTKNTSLYMGYAMTWAEQRSNLYVGLAFAL